MSAAAGGCCAASAGARAPAAGPGREPRWRCLPQWAGSGGRGSQMGLGTGPAFRSPAEAHRVRTSLVPARAWAEPSRRVPWSLTGRAPITQVIPQPGRSPVPRADPACPARQAGLRVGGRADLPEVGCDKRGEQGAVARPGGRGRPLTSAVGVEEAQGDQGAGHQERQQQQPWSQLALRPRAAGDLHQSHWALVAV